MRPYRERLAIYLVKRYRNKRNIKDYEISNYPKIYSIIYGYGYIKVIKPCLLEYMLYLGYTEVDIRDHSPRLNCDAYIVRLWNHRKIYVDGIDLWRFIRESSSIKR